MMGAMVMLLLRWQRLSSQDTVTLHPYRSTAPETAAETYKSIRSLLSRYERINQASVVVSQGEVGYGRDNSSSADPITVRALPLALLLLLLVVLLHHHRQCTDTTLVLTAFTF